MIEHNTNFDIHWRLLREERPLPPYERVQYLVSNYPMGTKLNHDMSIFTYFSWYSPVDDMFHLYGPGSHAIVGVTHWVYLNKP